jgi:NADH-quinone oxidoreductase subunit E
MSLAALCARGIAWEKSVSTQATQEKPADGKVALTPELKKFIAAWKSRPGNLVMILHRVQETFGYIPRKVAFEVADLLEIPLAKIYGVVTFYNFFKLKKPGRNIIQVCLGTACYLRGGDDLIQELEETLGIGVNATTADDEFSLEAVRCLGCCGMAPVMVINGDIYGKVEPAALPGILNKYRKAS